MFVSLVLKLKCWRHVWTYIFRTKFRRQILETFTLRWKMFGFCPFRRCNISCPFFILFFQYFSLFNLLLFSFTLYCFITIISWSFWFFFHEFSTFLRCFFHKIYLTGSYAQSMKGTDYKLKQTFLSLIISFSEIFFCSLIW